jgi:hypothetical protein
MTSFRTEIFVDKPPVLIQYSDVISMIGSCFAENIGRKFTSGRFNVMVNPHGIIYNPASIRNTIMQITHNKQITESYLHQHNGIWHSFDHHGDFSSTDSKETVTAINQSLHEAHQHLRKSHYLFITFGTAWVFEHLETQKVVANCHKLPSNSFKRYRLEVEEITAMYNQLINELFRFNPTLRIVFTVSPVRHIKDGAHGNQLSKSTLLLAINQLITKHPQLLYFPAYEIMNDDLRDYRFYESDMLHPNNQAIDYIWNKFSETWFDDKAQKFYGDAEEIEKARQHRPFLRQSTDYLKFINASLQKIERLSKTYPLASFENDVAFFRDQLKSQGSP